MAILASEADRINLALFGMTAQQWRKANPTLKGNIRDYATTEQLLVLSNLQSLNAKLIEWDTEPDERLRILNETAIAQMNILVNSSSLKLLEKRRQKKLKP